MELPFALRDFIEDARFPLRFARERTDAALLGKRRQRNLEIGERWAIEADKAGPLRGLRQLGLNEGLIDIGDDIGRIGASRFDPDDVKLDCRESAHMARIDNRRRKVRTAATNEKIARLQPGIVTLHWRWAIGGFSDNLSGHDIAEPQVRNALAFRLGRGPNGDLRNVG